MMPFIYVAGPYTGKTHDHLSYFQIDQNIMRAVEAAAQLALSGVPFFCPHQHSAHFEVITPAVAPTFWYDLDVHFMEACDAILLLPGWQESKGSLNEKKLAEERGIPVLYSVEEAIEWAYDNQS